MALTDDQLKEFIKHVSKNGLGQYDQELRIAVASIPNNFSALSNAQVITNTVSITVQELCTILCQRMDNDWTVYERLQWTERVLEIKKLHLQKYKAAFGDLVTLEGKIA